MGFSLDKIKSEIVATIAELKSTLTGKKSVQEDEFDGGDKTGQHNVKKALEPADVVTPKPEKSKRKIKPLHIAAIIMILWVVLDEEPLIVPDTPAPIKVVKKKVNKNLNQIKKIAEKVEAAEKHKEVIVEKKVQPQVTDRPKKINKETVTSDPVNNIENAKVPVVHPQINTAQVVEEVEIQEMIPKEKVVEIIEPEVILKVAASSVGESLEAPADVMTTDTSDVTESILEDLERELEKKNKRSVKPRNYIAPIYSRMGRGLVYSCTGKHWACVNAENFGKCEQNFSFLNGLDKSLECYPKDVYVSVDDCNIAQQYKIDSVEETDFCK